jgi:hypothetical protein
MHMDGHMDGGLGSAVNNVSLSHNTNLPVSLSPSLSLVLLETVFIIGTCVRDHLLCEA